MKAISLPAQIARTRRFTLGVPDQFTIGPDAAQVLFVRGRADDDPVGCLWALDLESGTERRPVARVDSAAVQRWHVANPAERRR